MSFRLLYHSTRPLPLNSDPVFSALNSAYVISGSYLKLSMARTKLLILSPSVVVFPHSTHTQLMVTPSFLLTGAFRFMRDSSSFTVTFSHLAKTGSCVFRIYPKSSHFSLLQPSVQAAGPPSPGLLQSPLFPVSLLFALPMLPCSDFPTAVEF